MRCVGCICAVVLTACGGDKEGPDWETPVEGSPSGAYGPQFAHTSKSIVTASSASEPIDVAGQQFSSPYYAIVATDGALLHASSASTSSGDVPIAVSANDAREVTIAWEDGRLDRFDAAGNVRWSVMGPAFRNRIAMASNGDVAASSSPPNEPYGLFIELYGADGMLVWRQPLDTTPSAVSITEDDVIVRTGSSPVLTLQRFERGTGAPHPLVSFEISGVESDLVGGSFALATINAYPMGGAGGYHPQLEVTMTDRDGATVWTSAVPLADGSPVVLLDVDVISADEVAVALTGSRSLRVLRVGRTGLLASRLLTTQSSNIPGVVMANEDEFVLRFPYVTRGLAGFYW